MGDNAFILTRDHELGTLAVLDPLAETAGKTLVPVVIGLPSDHVTPLQVYASVRAEGGPSVLLESVPQGQNIGRHSVIGCRARSRFVAYGDSSTVTQLQSGHIDERKGDTLKHLQDFIQVSSPLPRANIAPFLGGAVGYVGFEAVTFVEPTVPRHEVDELGWPDIELYAFDELIVFDHAHHALYLVALADRASGEKAEQVYKEALTRAFGLSRHLTVPLKRLECINGIGDEVVSNMTRQEYCDMVEAGKRYVEAGEVFQVVLSQRFSTTFNGDPLTFYRHLRRCNPSPYMFYLEFDAGRVLAGASPEVMVRVVNGEVYVRPIAGTRRRDEDPETDERLKGELAIDPKERAEHRMLVDLARNDVGRVAVPGSVEVSGVMRVETYSTVHHMVTDVKGRLRKDVSPLQAFWACTPAGTLSGAPKVRACQIIAELESCVRGPYGNAVGWFTSEAIDTGITIRSSWFADGRVYWQAGGGVVADSTAIGEYEESITKARSIFQVLENGIKEKK